MKKKYIILLIAIILLNITDIKALNLGEKTDGESQLEDHIPCTGSDLNGCSWDSKNFVIRVSLIDENLNIVPGTKTVEFMPYNPYTGGNYTTYDIDKSNSEPGVFTLDRINYNFLGSAIAKTNGKVGFHQPESMSDKGYWVYLGFGKNQAVTNDFSDYSENRRKFMKYVTQLEQGIYVQDIDAKVDFLSFFLKVSGFDDAWNSTENYEKCKKVGYDNHYFLLIEPVYSYGTWWNGKEYVAKGTAKALAAFYEQTRAGNKQYLWIADSLEVRYNHTCNFMDLSDNYTNMLDKAGIGTYMRIDGQLRKVTAKEIVERNRTTCNSIESFENALESYDNKSTTHPNLLLYSTGTGFGVNVIDIKEILKSRIENFQKASCTLNINSCTTDTNGSNVQPNDNFVIETKLLNTDGDIFNCIYPNNKTATTEEQLGQYVYHLGEGNNQLWCYDDIKYDFSKIKNILRDNTFYSNQLLEVPNGTLTVERTCYTTSSTIDKTGYLDEVFKNDPGQYQDKFIIKLNNQNLEFSRNINKYKTTTDTYKLEKKCDRSGTNCKYYKYTSTFYYDYELKKSFDSPQLSVNIFDLELNNALSNTNSIDFITKYNNSKVIKINNNIEEGTNSNKLMTEISNGYGLTNKMYNKLSNQNIYKSTINAKTDDEIEINRGTQKVSDLVSMSLDLNRKKACTVTTTIESGSATNKQFRVISLSNPFPARDGTSRLPGENWLNSSENNVYDYIENNRNVSEEKIYQQEPLYTITLDTQAMVRIREYNKSHNYSQYDITCETGTGRMCISDFLRNTKYINNLEGTCSSITPKEITNINKKIIDFENSGCNQISQCMSYRKKDIEELDANKDGYVTSDDLLNADFYTCADKTSKSGG